MFMHVCFCRFYCTTLLAVTVTHFFFDVEKLVYSDDFDFFFSPIFSFVFDMMFEMRPFGD